MNTQVVNRTSLAAYPRNTSSHKTLHPAVAFGHGGMESGGVGRVSIGGAIAYRRLPSDVADDVVKGNWLFHVVFSRDALRTRGSRSR
ncbi:hypothetical protein RB5369 [Rhodopirellula baltica SH 1]|uniref:Uncharacterized protein n=1 Tax=Rhodopirellula baltica (strain DSM 10527 / NCIMB 13988 / SH1) TaxID=243090 RepID=Q7URZ1_RHOBA|nr:hypothetical protein RB5369 [Rhodopirellula baltica SH 1]